MFCLNKTAPRALHRKPRPPPPALPCAPPQDGARRPEAVLRQVPVATVRHGRDEAGAEPDAALEPVRGAGGGAAGPRGVAAGKGEARPGLLRTTLGGGRPAAKSARPGSALLLCPRSSAVRLLEINRGSECCGVLQLQPRSQPCCSLCQTECFSLMLSLKGFFSPQYVAALEDMLRELKKHSK